MPRPKRPRSIDAMPRVTEFSPQGIAPSEEVILSLEELEAVRLIDYDGLDQSRAAEVMNVSRQTVGRILRAGRFKLAKAWWRDAISRCRAGATGSIKTGPAGDVVVTDGVAGAVIPTDHNHTHQGGDIMPGFNRRGPDNQGPMTGWGRGFCTGNAGYAGYDTGFGRGYGRGRGRRWTQGGFIRRGTGSPGGTSEPQESMDELKQRAEWLESELAAIRQQLNE